MSAPVLKLMSALVLRGAFDKIILPLLEAAGGHADIDWAPTAVIMERLDAGERADLLIITTEALSKLADRGMVDPATCTEIVRSPVGAAVARGAVHPDISTAEAVVRTLLRARSVAYSKAGASGIYFAGLLRRLGIAEAVDAKATIIPAGFTAEKLVSGEVDIAIQQISELLVVPGIEIVGALPDEIQEVVSISAGISHHTGNRAAAEDMLALMKSDAAAAAYRAAGLQPAFG